jgi:hypothetical protein
VRIIHRARRVDGSVGGTRTFTRAFNHLRSHRVVRAVRARRRRAPDTHRVVTVSTREETPRRLASQQHVDRDRGCAEWTRKKSPIDRRRARGMACVAP